MVAIPSSLLATFITMARARPDARQCLAMGLSLIIGILVDDSIVVLENITRHRDMGQSPGDAAISGRTEIGGAAIAITLVDVVVFLPLAFLSGFVGQYMKEFGDRRHRGDAVLAAGLVHADAGAGREVVGAQTKPGSAQVPGMVSRPASTG